jgi:hypothetical protein
LFVPAPYPIQQEIRLVPQQPNDLGSVSTDRVAADRTLAEVWIRNLLTTHGFGLRTLEALIAAVDEPATSVAGRNHNQVIRRVVSPEWWDLSEAPDLR